MIAIGDKLPDLPLRDCDGNINNLSTYLGYPLVVYFYPKADTPGCTIEAQDFTRLGADFGKLQAHTVGISRDKPEKLRKFRDKYDLSVQLLSDEEGAVCEAFGTWVEKKNYGRLYMGIERATFCFDAEGVCTHVWRKVRAKGHAEAVLAAMSKP